MSFLKRISSLLLAAPLLGACSGGQRPTFSDQSLAAPPTTSLAAATTNPPTSTTQPVVPQPEITTASSYVVGVDNTLEVFAVASATVSHWELSNPGPFDGPRVLEATGVTDGTRIQVVVPRKPNGTLGWVEASDVTQSSSDVHIVVDLSDHTATLTVAGETIHTAPVAIGTANTPTPLISAIVDVLLVKNSTSGVFGSRVLGLNQHSEALNTFNGGRPAIALHGTNQPT